MTKYIVVSVSASGKVEPFVGGGAVPMTLEHARQFFSDVVFGDVEDLDPDLVAMTVREGFFEGGDNTDSVNIVPVDI